MPLDNNSPWSFDGITEDLGTNQESINMPSFTSGNGYEQVMLANSSHVFGLPVPCPPHVARNFYQAPQQPIDLFTNLPDASVQTSFPGANLQYLPATSTPANGGFSSTASPFSFHSQTTSNTSLSAQVSQTSNGNPQACPQRMSIDPNSAFTHYPEGVPSGVTWQMQTLPLVARPGQCPPAPGGYHQTTGQPPDINSSTLQYVPQQIHPASLSQSGIPGQPLASIQPGQTSAFVQTQSRANSAFGVGPSSQGGSSTGTRSFSNSHARSPTVVFARGHYENANANPFGPAGQSGVPNPRYHRMRRTASQTPRYDVTRLPFSHSISRHALPKGLDDPLDKRPEPKETAEMTLNMECKVCMSQPVDTAVFPCGHAMLCRWCAEQCIPSQRSEKSRHKEPPRCPMCRGIVRQKMRIFLT